MSVLESMHRNFKECFNKIHDNSIKRHNESTHIRSCNFDVSDFILRSFPHRKNARKISFWWRGPYLVTKAHSDFHFEFEDLQPAKKCTVHGTHLNLFRNKDYEVTTDTLELLNFHDGNYWIVEEIQEIRINEGGAEILIKWQGLKRTFQVGKDGVWWTKTLLGWLKMFYRNEALRDAYAAAYCATLLN